jgi:hypothetical protein
MAQNFDQLSENINDTLKVDNTGEQIRRFSDVLKTDYSGITLGEVKDKPNFGDPKTEAVGDFLFSPVDVVGAGIGALSGDINAGIEKSKHLRNYIWDTTAKTSANVINQTYWGAAGLLYGALPQAIGNLTGDTDLVEQGVFVRDYTKNRINEYSDRMALSYAEKPSGLGEEIIGSLGATATQITPALIGGASGGSFVAKLFGSDAMFSYINDKTGTKEEMMQQTAGGIASDVAWSGLIGSATYAIDKFTGGLPTAEKLFAKSGKDLFVKSGKKIARTALEEGFGEVTQNMLPEIADRIRGKKNTSELLDDVLSRENLVTFIASSILGGTLGGAEYFSARGKMQGQIKNNLRNRFGITDESKLESISGKLMTGSEEMISEVRKQIMVDDQLKNKYGIAYNRIYERVNTLINQTIENGEMPDIEGFTGVQQAQLVGSVSQRFTDELYAQAILRGVPVSEVFDETKIDVENGIMYMYGESYGKRNLAKFGSADVEQYTKNQIISNQIDDLQRQLKKSNKEQKIELESKINELKNQQVSGATKSIVFPVKATGKGTIGGFNPIKGTVWLKQGWNETTLSKEMSMFWLDNMKRFANSTVGKNTEFAKTWNSIKSYLDIDDRQRTITKTQAEKFASAYLEFLRTNKTPYNVDMGFKSMDEWFANIGDEFFENYLNEFTEIEKATPEMIDVFQKLTSADLSKYKDLSIKKIEEQVAKKETEKVKEVAQEETSPEQDAKERGLPKEAASPKYQTPKPIQEYSKGEGKTFIRGGTKSTIKGLITSGMVLDLSEVSDMQLEKVRDSKKAAERAADFVVENPDLAIDIINFNAPLPENMLMNELLMAMRHKAKISLDTDLAKTIINSPAALSITDQARNLQALGVNRFDRQFDPIRAIMAIEASKMKSESAKIEFQELLSKMQKEITMEMEQSDFNGLIEILRC